MSDRADGSGSRSLHELRALEQRPRAEDRPGLGPAPERASQSHFRELLSTAPLTPAPAGASLQSLADQAGVGGDWQDTARANGIENPRLLNPGQLIDLNRR
mgnify:CR=1 FL=1